MDFRLLGFIALDAILANTFRLPLAAWKRLQVRGRGGTSAASVKSIHNIHIYIYIEFWLRFLLEARVSTVLCIFELQLETGTHRGWRISALVYMSSLSRQCSVLQCICNYICI